MDEPLHTDTTAATEHRPEFVHRRDVHRSLHSPNLVGQFNAAAALRITKVLSSMWFFWFCLVLDLIELPAVIQASSVMTWVTYIAQTVIQLLALPALGAGQALMQATNDARAEADHKTLVALHTMNRTQLQILEALQKLGTNQDELLNRIAGKAS